jgi:hypothetical protein
MRCLLAIALSLPLFGQAKRVDDAALKNAAKSASDGDWLSYGLTPGETRQDYPATSRASIEFSRSRFCWLILLIFPNSARQSRTSTPSQTPYVVLVLLACGYVLEQTFRTISAAGSPH